MYNSLLLYLLLFLLALPTSFAKEQEYNAAPEFMLHWGFVHFPPLIYLDENKQAQGDLAEIMAATSHYSGIPYQALLFPNIRAIFNLNQQNINFAIGVKSLVNNKNNFIISAFPVAKLQLRILWRADSAPVTSIEDLKDQKIVLLTGYTYGGLREKFEKISASKLEVENHHRAISALTFKRSDYALVYKSASEYNLTAATQSDFKHAVIGEVDMYFLLDSTVPNATQVMKRLENGFLQHKNNLHSESESIHINVKEHEK